MYKRIIDVKTYRVLRMNAAIHCFQEAEEQTKTKQDMVVGRKSFVYKAPAVQVQPRVALSHSSLADQLEQY